MVFFYQWAVKFLQGIQLVTIRIGTCFWQRSAHNLPTMTVEEYKHRWDVGTLDVEGAVAHVEGLEPVLQMLYDLLLQTIRLVVIAIPSYSAGVCIVTVPISSCKCSAVRCRVIGHSPCCLVLAVTVG